MLYVMITFSNAGVRVPGVADAELRSMTLTEEQMRHLADQIELQGCGELSVSVAVEFFLGVSNIEVNSFHAGRDGGRG